MAFRNDSVIGWVKKILHPHQQIGIPIEEQHLFQLFAVNAIDMTWSCRNRKEHDKQYCDALVLAARVRRLSWEHRRAWKDKLVPPAGRVWQPPPIDILKVNVDVAIHEEFAVVATIIRDFQGQVHGFNTERIGAVGPLIGEAKAAKFGVALAVQLGCSNIILEGDL